MMLKYLFLSTVILHEIHGHNKEKHRLSDKDVFGLSYVELVMIKNQCALIVLYNVCFT